MPGIGKLYSTASHQSAPPGASSGLKGTKMKDFDKLLQEAKDTKDNISNQFTELYNTGQDTTRLQRIFDKATDRVIRRMGCVWLLEQAKKL